MGLKDKVKGVASKAKGAVDEKRYAKQLTAAKREIVSWEKNIQTGEKEMAKVEKNAEVIIAKIDNALKIVRKASLSSKESDKLMKELKVLQNAAETWAGSAGEVVQKLNSTALSSTRNPLKEMRTKGILKGPKDPATETVKKYVGKTVKPLGYQISGVQKNEKAIKLKLGTAAKKVIAAQGILSDGSQSTDKLVVMVTQQVKKVVDYAKEVNSNAKSPDAKRQFVERQADNKDPKVAKILRDQYQEFLMMEKSNKTEARKVVDALAKVLKGIPDEVSNDPRIGKLVNSSQQFISGVAAELKQKENSAKDLAKLMKDDPFISSCLK